MCWNSKCFDFEDYRGKRIAVIICGPGFLEYSWALETVSYLKQSGANVSILDFSDYGSVYSLRLSKHGYRLPSISRRLLRKILLQRDARIEKIVERAAQSLNVNFVKFDFLSVSCFLPGLRKIRISKFDSQRWGQFSATEILVSLFSSFERRLLSHSAFVNRGISIQIKEVLSRITLILNDALFDDFDSIFLANGRQPIQAAFTLGLRNKGKQVILYEAGGGHIFPSQLQKRISYFFTSTSNPVEMQEKIICAGAKSTEEQKYRAEELLAWLEEKIYPPFGINFMSRQTSGKKIQLGKEGRNIAFFTSSDWETSILLDTQDFKTKSTSFSSQIDAVKELLNELASDDKLIIRLHPSDPGKNSNAEDYWSDFENDVRVTVVPMNADINSYALAEAATLSFVWNSTIGLEIAMMGLPVGVLGEASYAPAFGESWLKNPSEIRVWLNSPLKVSREQLLPFGIYFRFGGFLLESSRVEEGDKKFILGQRVDIERRFIGKFFKQLIRAIS